MKKLMLILLTTGSINAIGQINFVGVQGGLNMSNITSNLIADKKFKAGVLAGFNYEIIFNNKYSFGADLLYSQQGFKTNVTYTDENNSFIENDDISYNYNFLMLPIKFGYKIGQSFKFVPKIGIYTSILLKTKTTSPGAKYGDNKDYPNTAQKFDFGGLVESYIGYQLENGCELFSSITYRNSITTYSLTEYKGEETRHFVFSLLIGLKYCINK